MPEVAVSVASEGLLVQDNDSSVPTLRLPKLLTLLQLAASGGEAQRKLKENAVSGNGRKVSAVMISREDLGDSPTLRLGKKAVRVRWVD